MLPDELKNRNTINQLLQTYKKGNKDTDNFFVDIGAGSGGNVSNTEQLSTDTNWKGLSIEMDIEKFGTLCENQPRTEHTKLNIRITPHNVIDTFEKWNVPNHIDFLSIDIDGYDYYVLAKILENYSVGIIEAEINEKIPHPVKFTVQYDNDYAWQGNHFYGMSIAKLEELMETAGYTIVELLQINAFCVKDTILGKNPAFKYRTVEEIYNEGYKNNQIDYNADVSNWLKESPTQAISSINNYYNSIGVTEDKYEIGL
jgi:hypothetical protein